MHMDMSQEALVRKFIGKMPDGNPAARIWCEPAQSKCIWTCHKRHFVRKFTGKMPDANPAASILCEPAQSKCTWTCHKRHLCGKLQGKRMWCEPAQWKCIWTCHKRHFVQKFTGKTPDANPAASILFEGCGVEMHMDMSQEAFVQKFTGKMPALIPQQAFCASLRSRNAHEHVTRGICAENYKENACGASLRSRHAYGHVTRGILCRNLQGKCRTLIPQQAFCATCAVEMHMDMSQEAFVRKFTGKMPNARDTTSIEHRALTVTVRTPQSGHTVCGKKII